MNRLTHLKTVSFTAMAAATILSGTALAQAPAASDSETIIVTAGKRDEDIRQVALPISAVTGEQLNADRRKYVITVPANGKREVRVTYETRY